MWVTTTAAALLPPAACSADSTLSMVVTVFLYLFLFGYSCTSWIDLDSMQFCGVHGKSNALRKNLDHSVPDRIRFDQIFAHSPHWTDADLLTTRYFSASKLFHDSYFSLSTTSFDFFSLSFLFQSHTQREKCQRGHVLRRPSGHFRPFACPGRCLTVYSWGATDFTGPRAH